ncbi:ATP-dependent helicase [Clostridium algoriphilum]|uniref:ATP-dependent DNA helicase n=1 Tax=Clostridium algoriphilum TaxID=198347 RepID=UPI001CF4FE2D|nr:ATP-dependent DNA helicase [Clostridium algoriphilum]MCB2295456.1 ATP-dependent helicase [Clostridium algoriphilum]
MFDYGNANKNQIKAIKTVDGPLLIIAGPGTGKTFTLVKRAIYLIVEKGIPPEQIMIATFTEKASKELITRITNELMSKGVEVNINDMYIGTFHSICLRLIKENLEFTRIRKNYRILDGFEQQYTIFQYIYKFRNIENYETIFERPIGVWNQSQIIANLVSNISEELVNYRDMQLDNDVRISSLGKLMEVYEDILTQQNLIDFSTIQTEAYRLLVTNENVLFKVMDKIKYIMVDEYQDTNYVQEQLVFLIAGDKHNICVVGDDDQGLYRFRGATIRNILQFPNKFDAQICEQIRLTINYRSEKDIIEFYNNWMKITDGRQFNFKWGKYRFQKDIVAGKNSKIDTSAVIKISGQEVEIDWHENVLEFIEKLKLSGKLTNLNQIAFLFNSVRNKKVIALADYLELHGINVYSPRSDMFFMRIEIKLIIGCLMLTFPTYVQKMEKKDYEFLTDDLYNYYEECIHMVNLYLKKSKNDELKRWIREHGEKHYNLYKNTNYAFLGLMYQIFEHSPFREYLESDLNTSLIDLRPARNLAIISQIISKYEYLHKIDVFSSKNIDKSVEKFFNMYLKFLFCGGIGEYEDDSEYAPSGCVSFLTIHQSKGMEFPIVVVGSLGGTPRIINNNILEDVERKYYKRSAFEIKEDIKYFDFWRLYYTAFSRAQNLLVLSCIEKKGRGKQPSKYFESAYRKLHSYNDPEFKMDRFEFEEVKNVNLKNTYSFTSHIAVYENCAMQYKFFKELGFIPARVGATIFGMLVHQTIEDIHRTAIRKEEKLITPDNIKLWFDTNYDSISMSERAYIGQSQLDVALKQVIRYVDRQKGNWHRIQDAEVEVGLVKPNYILQGTVDLVEGEGNTVEIVDFKAEKKPDIFSDFDKIEHYKKQLQVYSHLIEEKTGKMVSKMHIYYTGEENSVPFITFPKEKKAIEATIKAFDDVVEKIQNKDFVQKSQSQILCNNCDLRFYCKK